MEQHEIQCEALINKCKQEVCMVYTVIPQIIVVL